MLGEMSEVAVARDERDGVVDAGLRDERVRHFGHQLFGDKNAADRTCAKPITSGQIKDGPVRYRFFKHIARFCIAQEFHDDDRGQAKPTVGQSVSYKLNVVSLLTGKESDQTACIRRDH